MDGFPEALVSYKFASFLSWFHSLMINESRKQKLMEPTTTSGLYNLSKSINESYAAGGFNSSTLHLYHPNNWNYLGYPHDTFAVQFITSSPTLSLYL